MINEKNFIKNVKVLLVNDNLLNLRAIEQIITKNIGINKNNIEKTINGTISVEKATNEFYNIIFMWIQMQNHDAF